MQAQQGVNGNQQVLLSASLDIPAGSLSVTRNNVQAALWQIIGWHTDGVAVSRLMAVIDAYADDRARRAVIQWVQAGRGDTLPPPVNLAQVSITRQHLRNIAQSVSVTTAAVEEHTRLARQRITVKPVLNTESTGYQRPHLEVVHPVPRDVPLDEVSDNVYPRNDVTTVSDALNSPSALESLNAAVNRIICNLPSASSAPEHTGDVVSDLPSFTSEDLYHCTGKCGRDLPRDSFYKDSSRKSGIASRCKDCKKAENTASRERAAQKAREARAQFAVSVGDDAAPASDNSSA